MKFKIFICFSAIYGYDRRRYDRHRPDCDSHGGINNCINNGLHRFKDDLVDDIAKHVKKALAGCLGPGTKPPIMPYPMPCLPTYPGQNQAGQMPCMPYPMTPTPYPMPMPQNSIYPSPYPMPQPMGPSSSSVNCDSINNLLGGNAMRPQQCDLCNLNGNGLQNSLCRKNRNCQQQMNCDGSGIKNWFGNNNGFNGNLNTQLQNNLMNSGNGMYNKFCPPNYGQNNCFSPTIGNNQNQFNPCASLSGMGNNGMLGNCMQPGFNNKMYNPNQSMNCYGGMNGNRRCHKKHHRHHRKNRKY